MVTVIALIGVALVLFAAAVLSTRNGGELADAPPDAADTGLPVGVLAPEDVAGVRFAMAPRGYRMAEVDEVLDRLATELADRDRRLALLEATITGGAAPVDTPDVDVVEAGEQDLPISGATTGERPAPPESVPLSTWSGTEAAPVIATPTDPAPAITTPPITATPATVDPAITWAPQPITTQTISPSGPEAPVLDASPEAGTSPAAPYAPDDPR